MTETLFLIFSAYLHGLLLCTIVGIVYFFRNRKKIDIKLSLSTFLLLFLIWPFIFWTTIIAGREIDLYFLTKD